ncbi:bZIP transcription factor 27 [Cajanus cajan]|uniref:bZIP transcription factor 27 n=1 Tax=Cajanus cajan TaxID=3821 RepID=UPI0010FB71CC|nr:bZIP transcription factor 27 [Cajanus cajan]
MEEVWKDINLATLNEQGSRPTTTHPTLMFQDFLARPLIDPPNTNTILSSAPSQLQTPPLVTALSLSSRPHFHPPQCTLADRRNNRMIKNRESAARSRARKQAYTNELELEIAQLKEENARLRRQHQQLSEVAASEQKKKGTLYRASTAPF